MGWLDGVALVCIALFFMSPHFFSVFFVSLLSERYVFMCVWISRREKEERGLRSTNLTKIITRIPYHKRYQYILLYIPILAFRHIILTYFFLSTQARSHITNNETKRITCATLKVFFPSCVFRIAMFRTLRERELVMPRYQQHC